MSDELLSAKLVKGNLQEMQRDLVTNGELLPDKTLLPSEQRVGDALIKAGIRVTPHFMVAGYEFDLKTVHYPLLIEIDGSIHRTPKKQLQDAKKDREAVIRGFVVVRFLNKEDLREVVTTVDRVIAGLKKQPREVILVRETFLLRLRRWVASW